MSLVGEAMLPEGRSGSTGSPPTGAPSGRTVAIVGGGLAGIAAAVRLVEAGHRPIVIETRRKLGGRATSFVDPRTDELIDNCQHVLMGCCTNLVDLYERLGVLGEIRWDRTINWANAPSAPDRMTPGWLPCPGHFSGSFLRMRLLSLADKIAVARAMWRLIRMGRAGRLAWRDRSFRAFLDQMRQPASTIERFWEPVVISACNLSVERVCAEAAMQVFQEGFLGSRWASAMGVAQVPLIDLYDPATALIAARGGEIRLGLSAKAIAFDGTRVTGVVTDEGTVEAAAVIAAVPPDRLDRLLSVALRRADRRLEALDRFEFSPILGVHLRFSGTILDVPHLVLPGRATQWLFAKGVDEQGRQHIHAVISGADAWMELDEAAIVERVLADIRACLPGAENLRPVTWRTVKEKRATFALLPGIDALRPPPAPCFAPGPGVANLFLAGDWCATGWPATMEGAVRSGYAAAGALCGSEATVPDLPMAPLARLLGLRR
ncbi:MAG TPA: hydroxysqualene dehydroxylase HpnE [Phycisphaerales bacterium]|nr:hydroxysqualene dehydroxylase HpnE [Phycisphaerales bacterium]HMP36478.1 hydroxysqualene dehydroxylase HpnE [Phycisphaerales bacterium]